MKSEVRFRNIVELIEIEERAAFSHFFNGERKFFKGFLRILLIPLFKVGIKKGHHIYANRAREISLLSVKFKRELRVFTF